MTSETSANQRWTKGTGSSAYLCFPDRKRTERMRADETEG